MATTIQTNNRVYFKDLENLFHEIENVRIRYYAENIASGYSKGIDIRLNGEFVKGMESGLVYHYENIADIENDFYKMKWNYQ